MAFSDVYCLFGVVGIIIKYTGKYVNPSFEIPPNNDREPCYKVSHRLIKSNSQVILFTQYSRTTKSQFCFKRITICTTYSITPSEIGPISLWYPSIRVRSTGYINFHPLTVRVISHTRKLNTQKFSIHQDSQKANWRASGIIFISSFQDFNNVKV